MKKAYPYIFDIDEWRERITISDDPEIKIRWMSGPYDVISLDSFTGHSDIVNDPVDLFVWELGEPDVRWATKIGGLPYRPAGMSWPTFRSSSGDKPMVFLAQFCFVNQPSIFGSLPGDVLLIFTEGGTFCSKVHFEWYDLGIIDLISSEEIPDTEGLSDPFVTCFGHVYRTDDRGCGCNSGIGCSKIGGRTPRVTVENPYSKNKIGDKFLCQLSSMQPTFGSIYPWLNTPEPISIANFFSEIDVEEQFASQLSLGDMGALQVFLTEEGECVPFFFSH